MVVSGMMKKLYSLFTLTPIKNVYAFQRFISVSFTFAAINNEEMQKIDFAWNDSLEVSAVLTRKNHLSMINMLPSLLICCLELVPHLLMKVLKQKYLREIHS